MIQGLALCPDITWDKWLKMYKFDKKHFFHYMIFDYVILKDIKPELSGYITASIGLMSGSGYPDDKAVHDIRVYMKQARAALKLIRPFLDEDIYKKEYDAYRETGRLLSAWRDTAVQRKTLKSFRKADPGLFKNLSEDVKVKVLLSKQDSMDDDASDKEKRSSEINDILRKALFRLRFLSLAGSTMDPEILLGQLEKTYLGAGEIYLRCRNNIKPECVHELRKACKDLLYQVGFFRSLNPSVIKKFEKALDSLAQDLGKYNDLHQLIASLDYKYKSNKNPALHKLVIMIRDRQDQYLSRVWPSAYKIFCPGRSLLNVLGYKVVVL